MNYNEYYKKQLEEGREFQDYVSDILYSSGLIIVNYSSKKYQLEKGENKIGVEVKYDKLFDKTGNLYIELQEKSNPNNDNYVNSGILRNDNSWLYVIGNYNELFIFSKKTLRRIKYNYDIIENNTKTSKGFLLPIKEAEKYCDKKMNTT